MPEVVSRDDKLRGVRLRELDGLRAVAVLVVVVYHTFDVLIPNVDQRVPNGFLGVDLFFVLSGFLITALLMSEHRRYDRISFGRFYVRRGIRLLPALIVLLAAIFVYRAVRDQSLAAFRDSALSVIFYYSNWRTAVCFCGINEIGHLWSLAVEEQFYMLWPLLLLGLVTVAALTRRLSIAIGILLVAIAIVVVVRIVLWNTGTPDLALYVRTDTRADSLLVGALLGFLWAKGRLPRRGLAVAAWLAVLFLAVVVLSPLGYVRPSFFFLGGFSLVAVACAVLIAASVESDWFARRWLRWRPLCLIGVVSYGLYLWHLPVFVAVADVGRHWTAEVRLVVALGLTAACTALSWLLVERPLLRWKSRFDTRPPTETDVDLDTTQPLLSSNTPVRGAGPVR